MNEMRKLMEAIEQINEVATPEQWEIAINNIIADGNNKFAVAGATIEQKAVWNWVKNELHGMLDFQVDNIPWSRGRASGRSYE